MRRSSFSISVFAVRFGTVLWLVVCLGMAGCGPKTVASTSGTVSGTVSFNGVPLTGGVVFLAPAADAPVWDGEIGEQGGYVVAHVAPGAHKVWLALTSQSVPPGLPSDKAFKSIPKEYFSADTTPLSVTVKVGRTTDFPIAIGQ